MNVKDFRQEFKSDRFNKRIIEVYDRIQKRFYNLYDKLVESGKDIIVIRFITFTKFYDYDTLNITYEDKIDDRVYNFYKSKDCVLIYIIFYKTNKQLDVNHTITLPYQSTRLDKALIIYNKLFKLTKNIDCVEKCIPLNMILSELYTKYKVKHEICKCYINKDAYSLHHMWIKNDGNYPYTPRSHIYTLEKIKIYDMFNKSGLQKEYSDDNTYNLINDNKAIELFINIGCKIWDTDIFDSELKDMRLELISNIMKTTSFFGCIFKN